jgi:hypothetical protein
MKIFLWLIAAIFFIILYLLYLILIHLISLIWRRKFAKFEVVIRTQVRFFAFVSKLFKDKKVFVYESKSDCI